MEVKFTEFTSQGAIPSGVPNFHSPESFREYVRLYWWNRCINQIEVLYPGDFAPSSAQSSGVVGQGTFDSTQDGGQSPLSYHPPINSGKVATNRNELF